jgi:hypothetical protein
LAAFLPAGPRRTPQLHRALAVHHQRGDQQVEDLATGQVPAAAHLGDLGPGQANPLGYPLLSDPGGSQIPLHFSRERAFLC